MYIYIYIFTFIVLHISPGTQNKKAHFWGLEAETGVLAQCRRSTLLLLHIQTKNESIKIVFISEANSITASKHLSHGP